MQISQEAMDRWELDPVTRRLKKLTEKQISRFTETMTNGELIDESILYTRLCGQIQIMKLIVDNSIFTEFDEEGENEDEGIEADVL